MSEAEKVREFVRQRIGYLENVKDQGAQKALLAQLRRGVGRTPGELPQLWGLLFQGMDEAMMSKNGEPTREEWAIYTALTLYAFHQQGRDPAQESMNKAGDGIGCAVATLVEREKEDDVERVQRRFNRFAAASNLTEAVTHLRGLVSLLKSKGIGLDYPRLAQELYFYQFYEGAKSVKLGWGQDFYCNLDKKTEEDLNDE